MSRISGDKAVIIEHWVCQAWSGEGAIKEVLSRGRSLVNQTKEVEVVAGWPRSGASVVSQLAKKCGAGNEFHEAANRTRHELIDREILGGGLEGDIEVLEGAIGMQDWRIFLLVLVVHRRAST